MLLGWGRFQICATSKGDSGNWGWGLGLGKLRSAEALPLCPPPMAGGLRPATLCRLARK